jgi:hydrogenase expression/formation protein HypE
MKGHAAYSINTSQMDEFVSLGHGSGGSLTGKLIREVFARRFGMSDPFTDSAILKKEGFKYAFTSDSYVVDPIFFPGGDIGKLAVCGTVNDLAVSGALPGYLSASFIIEEGFLMKDLIRIAESMAREAENAGIKIVTGDTKVVEKGKCDRIFITTSGIGTVAPEHEHISTAVKVKPGDKLIINGSVGNHSIAVLGARNELGFTSSVESDCAPLNHLIFDILNQCHEIHFMRDLTRGGLTAVLNELVRMTGSGIELDESAVPVEEPVRGLCEILGFDPFYLANEGKVLIVAGEEEHEKVLRIMRASISGKYSAVIGEVVKGNENIVILKTSIGGRRILNLPSGVQLPRIC